jgi:hypothetical protein
MARPSVETDPPKIRRTSGAEIENLTFDFDTFQKYYQEDPEQLFSNLNATLLDNERQIARLSEEVSNKEAQIDDLIAERDEYKDGLARIALERTPMSGTPVPEAPKKSTKLPDPPVLTDGKNPEFEDWLSRMKNKLAANADHYSTEALRTAYVENRTAGDAAKHLAPRLREGAANKFTTADEMFKLLETVFLDPNRLQTAKNDFRKLVMRKADNFHEFLTKFLHQAGEAKISPDEYKYELNNKLAFDLQKAVVTNYISDSTFDQFSAHCSQVSHTLQAIASAESRVRKSANTEKTGMNSKKESTGTGTATQKDADKAQLMKERKCFYCKEPGHVTRNCPVKKRNEEKKKATEVAELEDTEQEKDQP